MSSFLACWRSGISSWNDCLIPLVSDLICSRLRRVSWQDCGCPLPLLAPVLADQVSIAEQLGLSLTRLGSAGGAPSRSIIPDAFRRSIQARGLRFFFEGFDGELDNAVLQPSGKVVQPFGVLGWKIALGLGLGRRAGASMRVR